MTSQDIGQEDGEKTQNPSRSARGGFATVGFHTHQTLISESAQFARSGSRTGHFWLGLPGQSSIDVPSVLKDLCQWLGS